MTEVLSWIWTNKPHHHNYNQTLSNNILRSIVIITDQYSISPRQELHWILVWWLSLLSVCNIGDSVINERHLSGSLLITAPRELHKVYVWFSKFLLKLFSSVHSWIPPKSVWCPSTHVAHPSHGINLQTQFFNSTTVSSYYKKNKKSNELSSLSQSLSGSDVEFRFWLCCQQIFVTVKPS